MIKFIKICTYLFLFAVVAALVGLGGYQAYKLLDSQTEKPEYVPFGLDIGTELETGKNYSVPKELPKLKLSDQKLYKQAIQYHEMKGVKSSKKIFDGLLKKYPEEFALYYYATKNILAHRELSKTLLDDVRVYIKQAKALDPDHPALYYLTGKYNLVMNNSDNARKAFEKSIELSPVYPLPYFELAVIELQTEKYESALNYIKHSITLEKESLEKHYSMLAHVYHNMAELDTCFRVVNYSLDLFSYNKGLLYLKGLLLEYDGDVEEAKEVYAKILSFSPENKEAKRALTTIGQKIPPLKKRKKNNKDEMIDAVALLDSLVKDKPKNAWLRYALGVAYLQSGKKDKAESLFDKARRLEPTLASLNSEGKLFTVQIPNKKNVDPKPIDPVKQEKKKKIDKQAKEMLGKQIEQKIANLATQNKQGKVELGQYLVKWGSSEKEFFAKYPKDQFKLLRKGVYRETFYVDDILHEHVVRFDQKGFWGVHVYLTDTTKTYRDLLGTTVRLNSRISGNGVHKGQKKCPGYKAFESVSWTKTKDNYELITQFSGKTWQVRMIRLSPDRLTRKPINVCEVVPRLVEYKAIK